jgi:hypothetical protein
MTTANQTTNCTKTTNSWSVFVDFVQFVVPSET